MCQECRPASAPRMPSGRVLKAFDRRRAIIQAQDPHAERPFWGPHPDPTQARIEADFYGVGDDYLRHLYAAALGGAPPRTLTKAFHLDPGEIPGWGKLADLFSSRMKPQAILEGWEAITQKLVQALLPAPTIEAAASRMAIQTHLMWRLGQKVISGTLEKPWHVAEQEIPTAAVESMAWAKTHGMIYLKGLQEESVQALRQVFLESKEAGEGAQGLHRRLFDKMSHLNHDWRRISITETAMAATNGQLVSVVGSGLKARARWIASPLACKHCLLYQGQTFDILAAPDASKGLTAIWPAKNNVGRSAYKWSKKEQRFREAHELYWPCQPLHPVCACAFNVET